MTGRGGRRLGEGAVELPFSCVASVFFIETTQGIEIAQNLSSEHLALPGSTELRGCGVRC